MAAEPAPSTSTIIVFHSISGSAGKSYLASLLFEAWTLKASPADTEGTSLAGPPLLVDADLVGATLSRRAAVGGIEGVPASTIAHGLTTLRLASERVHIPLSVSFVPAAPWVTTPTLEQLENVPFSPQNLKDLKKAADVLRAHEGLPDSLRHAQQAQARLARDPGTQRQLWRNLAAAAVCHGPRRVLVDLPAQGPTGVSLDENWRRICADATEAANGARGPSNATELRLLRVLVFMSERRGGNYPMPAHPLITQTQEGVRTSDPSMRDVVVVENFVEAEQDTYTPRIIAIPPCDRLFVPSPLGFLLGLLGVSTSVGQSTQDTPNKPDAAASQTSAVRGASAESVVGSLEGALAAALKSSAEQP